MKVPKIKGRKYRIIEYDESMGDHSDWPVGMIITLIHDDGTDLPLFQGPVITQKGTTEVTELSIRMSRLELLPEEYSYTEHIAKLEKELKELKCLLADAPWLKFKKGDKVRISFEGIVGEVESENYKGPFQVQVHSFDGEEFWVGYKDIEHIK